MAKHAKKVEKRNHNAVRRPAARQRPETGLNTTADATSRQERLWIDQPPPERDPELGIGKNVAWQTPIHREAVRRALRET